MGDGPYGDAQTLARAHNVEVEALSPRLLTSDGGRVQLQPIEADVYAGDPRQLRLEGITAWEGAFRMAHALDGSLGDTGVAGAAAVMRAMGNGAGAVERLARILYAHFDARGDSRNAVRWNGLAASWRDIEEEASRSARQGEMGSAARSTPVPFGYSGMGPSFVARPRILWALAQDGSPPRRGTRSQTAL